MTELKNRGVEDILIAVVDGLKGFPDAITSVFPQTEIQTCIVHLIRYSMQFASWNERKALASALKPIYQTTTAEDAREKLEAFSDGVWGRKYPMIVLSWKRNSRTGDTLLRLPRRGPSDDIHDQRHRESAQPGQQRHPGSGTHPE
jgi:putative transposase